jgi:hypothetical protein
MVTPEQERAFTRARMAMSSPARALLAELTDHFEFQTGPVDAAVLDQQLATIERLTVELLMKTRETRRCFNYLRESDPL